MQRERRQTALEGLERPELEGIEVDGVLRVLYSHHDLGNGWEGIEHPFTRGVGAADALKIGVNSVVYHSGPTSSCADVFEAWDPSNRLGRALVPELLSVGHAVRVLSRKPPSDEQTWRGDLVTGECLEEAVDGVGVIVHCATGNGRADIAGTRNLIQTAARAGRPHLIYVSIVGVGRVDMAYYRAKLAGRSGTLLRKVVRWLA